MQYILLKNSHSFNAGTGKDQSSFGYIAKGEGVFSSALKTFKAGEGDFIFIPEGTRYISTWSGFPNIEYYCIHTPFRSNGTTRYDCAFAFQRIEEMSVAEVGHTVREMYEHLNRSDAASRLIAFSMYYRLLSEALPYLEAADASKYSASVLSALAYIEEYYNDDFKIGELAQKCYVSESRLYHLFREELNTTPVEYRNKIKIQYAIEYLRDSDLSIEAIGGMLGFNSSGYFRRVFKSVTKLTPSEYRKLY